MRALLDFLVRTVPAEGSPYGMLLRQVVEDLRREATPISSTSIWTT